MSSPQAQAVARSSRYKNVRSLVEKGEIFFLLQPVQQPSQFKGRIFGMYKTMNVLAITALLAELAVAWPVHTSTMPPTTPDEYYISFGPRPYYLIQNMTESPLKEKLESCENGPFEITAWSIGQ